MTDIRAVIDNISCWYERSHASGLPTILVVWEYSQDLRRHSSWLNFLKRTSYYNRTIVFFTINHPMDISISASSRHHHMHIRISLNCSNKLINKFSFPQGTANSVVTEPDSIFAHSWYPEKDSIQIIN